MPATASASTQTVGERWASRLDPTTGIPASLALKAANAAIAHGMTAGRVAALFNYEPFAAAVGAANQGYGALEAMSEHPEWVQTAYDLMRAGGRRYTASGALSFQAALFQAVPELRNGYLGDLGHMVAMGPNGVEVLVDIETGRQVVGQGHLGRPITAPGGGPLEAPAVSPDEAAPAMWTEVGPRPDEVNPLGATPSRSFGSILYLVSGLALLLGLGVPAVRKVVSRRRETS